MVISYNQNLHFKIHCKKLQKINYNSFHHIMILQKIHTTIQTQNSMQKYVLLCIIENMNQNYNRSHVLLEKNPKTIIKICNISKQSMWFLIASTYTSSHSFPKIMCLRIMSFLFLNLSLLVVPNLHHDSKPTRIQNSN